MTYPRSFELLKLVAFGLMLLDHVDMVLLGKSQPWMHAISRVAFPLFVFVFAFGCGYARRIDRTMARLFGVAVIAQALWWWLVPEYGFNVLFVMLLAAVASTARPGSWWPAVAVFVLYLVAVPVLEGGALGFACIAIGLLAGEAWRGATAVPRWLAALADGGPTLPRLGPWLLWAYPLHLLVLGAVAGLVARS